MRGLWGRAETCRMKVGAQGIDQKGKRAGGPALFRIIILLPVGLADLMQGRYCGFTKPSTGKIHPLWWKKGRTGEGAASLTGRKSHRAAARAAGPDVMRLAAKG
jgi:hypothetical protein